MFLGERIPMLRRPGPAVDVPVPLSGFRMELIAQVVASRRGKWQHLLRAEPGACRRIRLQGAADHDVWLESWLPGRGTGWHDHGGSAGVVLVMRGELEERIPVLGGVVTQIRRIPAGGTRPLGRRQVHELVNASLAPAFSVHVYSPPLEATRGYEIGAQGLRRAPGLTAN
jgi:predicted metal-dependent enzyme (double-stranded beta helix superfamily)